MTKRILAAVAAALMIVMIPASAAAAVTVNAFPALTKSEHRIDPGIKAAAGPSAGKKHGAASLKKDSVVKNGLPGSFRLSCGEWTASHVKKVGEEKAARVSRQGLDTLRISGSGSPSPEGLALLKEEILRKAPEGTEIWIVDLRQETHFFADDTAMTVTDSDNTANRGMSTEEVLALEQEMIRRMPGCISTAGPARGAPPACA